MNKLVLLLFLTAACASTTDSPVQTTEPPIAPIEKKQVSVTSGRIDFEGLQRSLGLDRSKRDLGYEEKQFNTCEAGFGYSKENCVPKTFVSIHFRLQCRDSVGTTSEVVTSAQLEHIDNKVVKWQIGNTRAESMTDFEGYGQINAVFSNSPRTSRLRLAVGNQFVYVRAGEVTRIVTPANWCSEK